MKARMVEHKKSTESFSAGTDRWLQIIPSLARIYSTKSWP